MMHAVFPGSLVGFALVVLIPAVCLAEDDSEKPFGIERRVAWTGTRVVGSPEPPLPYVATKAFSAIDWKRPLYMKPEPGTNQLIVVLQGGEEEKPSKLMHVEERPDVDEISPMLEMPGRLIYGLEFHPDYNDNGFVFVFSNGPTGESERKNRISRFTVSRDSETDVVCDPDSELVILEWRSMGHDGGDIVFGHDGMMYATTGDGTSDSDNWLSAQDVTNLLGGVIRIDVDHPADDLPYSIPADNPFVNIPDARGELWAIGLRNPWRMTIDSATGQIWVGNNGQDLWETVHLLGRGQNYGWSVYEGSHPFYANRDLGPGTLTTPTFEHHHTEARSLTGGVVYDGDRLADLKGAYIYGDYSTGKIWAARHDGTQVTWHREIADTAIQIAGFSNSHRGELFVVDHGGGIYRLEANPARESLTHEAFPRKLSETGLFESVGEHRVAAGVIPYSVNAPAWNDGASAERFMAIPNDEKIEYASKRGWSFPNGAVLVQTLSLGIDRGGETTKRRIETRIMTRQQGEWSGYSYQWNAQQDDALLVERDGKDILLDVALGDEEVKKSTWRIPSRAECMTCHSRAVNYCLGMTELQMNRTHVYGDADDNQLRSLDHIGLFSEPLPKPPGELKKLADPHDETAELESRAKSYLHANCSGCHVQAGGGNARMELEFNTPLERMKVVSHFPQHDTFGVPQPLIIAPGHPDRSIMLARLTRRGRGQMPPLVSNRVDRQGADLIRQWIASMPPDREFVKAWTFEDIQDHLPEAQAERSLQRGEELFRTAGCAQCHRIQDENAGIGPNLTGLSSRMKVDEIVKSIVSPSATIDDKYAQTIVVTADGGVVQGRVVRETDEAIVLRGTESQARPITIPKDDIEQRSLSKVSMMPDGTINHLQLEEILDLVAYLRSGGDPDGSNE